MQCTKRKYRRRREAKQALKRIQARVPAGCKRVRSAYRCRHCGWWHLTSQVDN